MKLYYITLVRGIQEKAGKRQEKLLSDKKY